MGATTARLTRKAGDFLQEVAKGIDRKIDPDKRL